MASFESVNSPDTLLDLNQPVDNYAISRDVPAEPVHKSESEPLLEPESQIPPVLLDLNKPPSPDSIIDENETLGFGDEGGGCGASEVREIAKGEVEERSSSFWNNKRKSFFKWLRASAKIFKKNKKDDSNA